MAVDWLCVGWIGLALRSVPYSPGSISLLRDVRTGWYSIGSGLVINWQIGEGLVFDCLKWPWIEIVATPDRGSKMMPS